MQKFRVLLAGIVIGGLLFLGTQRIHMVTRDEKSYSEYWLKISMNPVPLSALAKIAQNEKHYELALRLYELHLNTFAYSPLNENSPWMIELAMASIYIELSQYNQAREFINRALTKNPQAHLAYLLLASIAADHKNYLQAEKYFLKAVDLAPGNRLVMTSLIDFYFFMKEDEKALPLLEKMPISELTNKDRIHCEILRSMIKYKNNDRFAALEILDHILKLYPAENTYKIIIEKYSARLIHEVARYYAQEGLVHYPVSADLRLYYGTILSNMGDHQLALNELRKGAQLFPQDLRFKDRIAKISTRLSIP